MKKIFFVAGEQSGDLHAGKIMAELNKKADFTYLGIGGDRMIAAGLKPIYHVKDLGMMGITEVLKHFFFIRKVFKETIRTVLKEKPDLVFLTDFSEFNLRLALKLKTINSEIKIFRFVAPQIWATRPGRIKKIVKAFDRLFCILPFEVKLYDNYPIKAEYVGHPLISQYKTNLSDTGFKEKFRIPSDKKLIGIFPGSRKQEIEKHLRVLKDTITAYTKQRNDLHFVICKANNIELKLDLPDTIVISEEYNYELLTYADFLWCKSGTTSLQATLARTPALVFYKLNWLTYRLARMLIQIDYVSLVNIMNKREIYPELIQKDFNQDNLIRITDSYLSNKKLREDCFKILDKTIKEFGNLKAEKVIASRILTELK